VEEIDIGDEKGGGGKRVIDSMEEEIGDWLIGRMQE
jgi:hypothetical protein